MHNSETSVVESKCLIIRISRRGAVEYPTHRLRSYIVNVKFLRLRLVPCTFAHTIPLCGIRSCLRAFAQTEILSLDYDGARTKGKRNSECNQAGMLVEKFKCERSVLSDRTVEGP